LIDTPGFDDTYRSDAEVLGDIVNWLNQAYIEKIQLTGILYIHPISAKRMGKKATDSISSFKMLCGADALRKVVLVTTFWDQVDYMVGEGRERELRESALFWAIMLKRGSKVFRHYNHRSTAKAIIQHLLDIRTEQDQGTFLDIQKEMVVNKLQLDQTSAGKLMMSTLEQQRLAFERELADLQKDLERAIEEQNRDHLQLLETIRKQAEDNRRLVEEDISRMQATCQRLKREIAEKDDIKYAEEARLQQQREDEVRALSEKLRDLEARDAELDEQKEIRGKVEANRKQIALLKSRQKHQLRCVFM
jgi:hypothetical protein